MARRCARRRRDPSEEDPVHGRGHRRRLLVAGVEPDPHPERHEAARDGPGHPAQRRDGQGQEAGGEQQRREGHDPGLERVVEDRHLQQQPADPLGGQHRDLERDVGAQRGAADDRLLGTEVVEQGDHLLAEGGHRVGQRVRRTVGAAVPEQVEGHHVQTLGRQGARERLVHPARHQLAVQEHHPRVARAVLGVLEPVPSPGVLEEELADPLADQHGGQSRASSGRQARLTAEMTALSDAVTMLASSPTPHRTFSPTAHSTYAAAMASPPEDRACSW